MAKKMKKAAKSKAKKGLKDAMMGKKSKGGMRGY